MGLLIAKFRKSKSTLEILENVDKEIKAIEEFRRDTEQTQKRIVGRFVVISVGAYLCTAFTFYFYFFPADFYDQLFYIIPLIFAPVIIITVKRVLTWYYRKRIARKQSKLFALREEKKKLLDQVKEKETYKVAKTILDKYAPENPKIRSVGPTNDNIKTPMIMETPMPPDTILRQRAPLLATGNMPLALSTPMLRPVLRTASKVQAVPSTGVLETPAPLPRGILPRNRSVFDKMVDYLVGDGPSNRFALICKSCYSHNGMAHKDEFEYVSFRCCYCFAMNLARKKRPDGPKLDFDIKQPPSPTRSVSSESEKISPSDSESEAEQDNNGKTLPSSVEVQEQQPMEIDAEETNTKSIIDEIEDDLSSLVKPVNEIQLN